MDDRFEAVLRERALLAGYRPAPQASAGTSPPSSRPRPSARSARSRDPSFTLLRFHDGIGLAGPDRSYRINADAARLWLSLDGRRTPTAFGDPDSPAARGVAQLSTIGAAHHPSSSDSILSG